ncbi:uncharacterized protein N7500_001847 [Penicillium coprophilum]|uniref:uncharacterized protein n=1 Tax=Penicillium coprophilum TaxID=36646 RepID=UPI0023888FF5|nr:uncharacterized protein N7500_001847 [Penicillium coprophilum]KAJ5173916.1 hypothetical protein N7500_001847 [Penicillium coprophilum]
MLSDSTHNLSPSLRGPRRIIRITQRLSSQRIKTMRDMVPGPRLFLAGPELEKAIVDNLQAVQVVEAMKDIDSFVCIPGKSLRRAKIMGCSKGIRESDDPAVNIDGVPEGVG